MINNLVCLKPISPSEASGDGALKIDGVFYAVSPATKRELECGSECLAAYFVERQYKTQVAGLGRVYYDMKSEAQELRFEELIFNGTECIGAYHDEMVFIFDDKATHYQQKYLGEMPTGPDQSISFYDYYYLRTK